MQLRTGVTGYVYQDHSHPLVKALMIAQGAADELAKLAQRDRKQYPAHVPHSWVHADRAERIRCYLAEQVRSTDACWNQGFRNVPNGAAQEAR